MEVFKETKEVRKNAVIKYEVAEDGCWICVSHRIDMDGYPHIGRNGKDTSMSRHIYRISNNTDIPNGLEVMHECDNPGCINPAHLEVGTHAENMRHKKERNKNPKKPVKLTIQQREDILNNKTGTIKQLALEYNVSNTTIKNIRRKYRLQIKNTREPNKPSVKNDRKGKSKKKKENKTVLNKEAVDKTAFFMIYFYRHHSLDLQTRRQFELLPK